MEYRLYNRDPDMWVKVYRRIKKVCRETGAAIYMVEEVEDGMMGTVTIIRVAVQQRLC